MADEVRQFVEDSARYLYLPRLAGLVGADVTVTLEIGATLPGGASEQLVRTVTENSRTLKFIDHGLEEE